MDEENDSDKENKDPAEVKVNQQLTPTSKKKVSRKKERSKQGLVVTQLNEPVSLSEVYTVLKVPFSFLTM